MVAIEYDEFSAGRADRIHSQLFADLMTDLGLDAAYGRYLEQAPAPLLATVNLMSLFGLHRALRGALVGHFACVEVTSSPGSRRLAKAMRRCGAVRPPSTSTPSTLRPTPSTSRSYATKSSAASSPTHRTSRRTSRSAAPRPSCSKTVSRATSAKPGTTNAAHCARPCLSTSGAGSRQQGAPRRPQAPRRIYVRRDA